MTIKIGLQNLDTFIMVGDRVVIKPKLPKEKTKTGLYLLTGITEKKNIQYGYVLKVGHGYPIQTFSETDKPCKDQREEVKYIPLQPKKEI